MFMCMYGLCFVRGVFQICSIHVQNFFSICFLWKRRIRNSSKTQRRVEQMKTKGHPTKCSTEHSRHTSISFCFRRFPCAMFNYAIGVLQMFKLLFKKSPTILLRNAIWQMCKSQTQSGILMWLQCLHTMKSFSYGSTVYHAISYDNTGMDIHKTREKNWTRKKNKFFWIIERATNSICVDLYATEKIKGRINKRKD